MPVDELDDLLSTRGARYDRWGERGAEDVGDLGHRAGRQVRSRRLAAGGAALVVAAVVLAGAWAAARPGNSAQRVEYGDPTGQTSARTEASVSLTPSTSAASSTVPTTAARPDNTSATIASSTVPARPTHAVDWKNMTYPADTCGSFGETVPRQPYVVRDGQAPVGGPNGLGFTVRDDPVVGDLTGDGTAETVVTVDCETGGSARWTKVWLYTADTGATTGARRLGPVAPFDGMVRADGVTALYDPRALASAGISGGRLTTRWRIWADDDPNCCASEVGIVTQHWNGTALVNDGPPTVTGG